MGATWAGVHLRGVPLADVEREIDGWAVGRGLERVSSELEDPARSRRILLLEHEGWVSVCDEDAELDEEVLLSHAERLSRAFETLAVSLQVVHSDTAMLALHGRGERLGAVRVPEGAARDDDGRGYVDASFLAPLAPEVPSGEWRVRGDHTFPEETLFRLASLAGVPGAGTGARHGWTDPEVAGVRMIFLAPAAAAPRVAPSGDGPTVLQLDLHPRLEAHVGVGLEQSGALQVSVASGPPLDGVELVLEGDALSLLDVRALRGWHPHGGSPEWLADAIVEPARRRFRFPGARPRHAPPPALTGAGAAALREMRTQMEAQARAMFVCGLAGEGARAGEGLLRVHAQSLDGRVRSPVVDVEVAVRALARAPHVPSLEGVEGRIQDIPARYVRALDGYCGADFAVGWIAFDAPFAPMEDALRRLLESGLALLLEIAGSDEAPVTLTHAGTHPEISACWSPRNRLDGPVWRPFWKHLREEGIATFRHGPHLAANGGAISLAHQPRGSTHFTAEARRSFEAAHPQPAAPPIELAWCVPRPASKDLRERLAAWMDGAAREACAMERCLGALVAASGEGADPLRALPYEELAGTWGARDAKEWLAAHVRAPGWRVLVPRPASARLGAVGGEVASLERVAAGVLVSAHADDPFALAADDAAREVLERLLLPCVGTARELRMLFRPAAED